MILGRGLEERLGPAPLQGASAQPFPCRVKLTDATRAPFGEPFSLPHCLTACFVCEYILPQGARRSPEIIRFSVVPGLAGRLSPPTFSQGCPGCPALRSADKGRQRRHCCGSTRARALREPGLCRVAVRDGQRWQGRGRGSGAPLPGAGGSGVPRCCISEIASLGMGSRAASTVPVAWQEYTGILRRCCACCARAARLLPHLPAPACSGDCAPLHPPPHSRGVLAPV